MSIENGKQPAFPVDNLEAAFGSQGLSKREWFAGLAMQGMLCNPKNDRDSGDTLAEYSIEYADALLKAIESEPKESAIDMLKAIVSHSNQPEMDDAQFRLFARENAQYVIDSNKGGQNG